VNFQQKQSKLSYQLSSFLRGKLICISLSKKCELTAERYSDKRLFEEKVENRRRRMRLHAVVSALAMSAALMSFSSASRADVYTITDCSNGLGCGTGNNFGTVTTTNISGGVDVSVTLAAGVRFFANFSPSIMFSLSGIPTVTYQNVPSNYTPASGGTQNAGSFSPDGIGTFSFGLTDTNANGFPGSTLGPLDFHVLASGLTTASFIAGTGSPTSNPLFFAFDVGIGCTATACANTGFAGATLTSTSPVPLPPAALLFGSALVGMTMLGRRRSQRKIAS
jgi:hypothetical protein